MMEPQTDKSSISGQESNPYGSPVGQKEPAAASFVPDLLAISLLIGLVGLVLLLALFAIIAVLMSFGLTGVSADGEVFGFVVFGIPAFMLLAGTGLAILLMVSERIARTVRWLRGK